MNKETSPKNLASLQEKETEKEMMHFFHEIGNRDSKIEKIQTIYALFWFISESRNYLFDRRLNFQKSVLNKLKGFYSKDFSEDKCDKAIINGFHRLLFYSDIFQVSERDLPIKPPPNPKRKEKITPIVSRNEKKKILDHLHKQFDWKKGRNNPEVIKSIQEMEENMKQLLEKFLGEMFPTDIVLLCASYFRVGWMCTLNVLHCIEGSKEEIPLDWICFRYVFPVFVKDLKIQKTLPHFKSFADVDISEEPNISRSFVASLSPRNMGRKIETDFLIVDVLQGYFLPSPIWKKNLSRKSLSPFVLCRLRRLKELCPGIVFPPEVVQLL